MTPEIETDIDKLKVRIKELEAEVERRQVMYDHLCRENDRLAAAGAKPADEVFPLLLENAKLRSRVEELEEALRGVLSQFQVNTAVRSRAAAVLKREVPQ